MTQYPNKNNSLKRRCSIYFLLLIIIVSAFFAIPNFNSYAEKNNDFDFDLNFSNSQDATNAITTLEFNICSNTDDFNGIAEVLFYEDYATSVAYSIDLSLPKGTSKQFEINIPTDTLYTYSNTDFKLISSDNHVSFSKNITNIISISPECTIGILSNKFDEYSVLDLGGNTLDLSNNYNYCPTIKLKEISPDNIDESSLNNLNILLVNNYDTSKLDADSLKSITSWVNTNKGILIIGGGSNITQSYPDALFDSLNITYTHGLPMPDYYSPNFIIGGIECPDVSIFSPEYYISEPLYKFHDNIFSLDYNTNVYISDFNIGEYTSDTSLSTSLKYLFLKDFYISLINYSGIGNYSNQSYINNNNSGISRYVQQFLSSDNYISFSKFNIILVVYLLTISPLIYFLLKKLKKQELIWIYAPVMAVLFLIIIFIISLSTKSVIPKVYSVNLVNTNSFIKPCTYISGFNSSPKKWSMKLSEECTNIYYLDFDNDSYSANNNVNTQYDLMINNDKKEICVNPNGTYQTASVYCSIPYSLSGDFECNDNKTITNNTGLNYEYITTIDGNKNVKIYKGKDLSSSFQLNDKNYVLSTQNSPSLNYYNDLPSYLLNQYYEEDYSNLKNSIDVMHISAICAAIEKAELEYNTLDDKVVVIGTLDNYMPVDNSSNKEKNIGCIYSIIDK